MKRILSLGAGVQSTTIALMAARGELPLFDVAIFADTGAEPDSVYAHLERVKAALPFPIVTVREGNLTECLLNGSTSTGQSFASIPAFTASIEGEKDGIVRRQCTEEFKLKPIRRYIRQAILGLKHGERWTPGHGMVEQTIGLSFDEAGRIGRVMKNCERWTVQKFPLFDMEMTRRDCQAWLAKHWPHPVGRSACVYCPFKRNSEWRWLRDNDTAGWEEACRVDEALRGGNVLAAKNLRRKLYVHETCVPLRKAVLADEDPSQMTMPWAQECLGMCGV